MEQIVPPHGIKCSMVWNKYNDANNQYIKQMKMKLTLIRTDKQNKQFIKLVPLENLLERLQKDNKAEDVEALRSFVRYAESWSIFDKMHKLPVVYPSAEMKFSEGGTLLTQRFNGLLTLTLAPLRDEEEVEAVKRMVAILPCTMLTLLGSSGRSLKIIVKACRPDGSLPQTEEEMEAFCQQAYPILCQLYEPLVRMAKTGDTLQIAPAEHGNGQRLLMTGFRMTVDQHLYYNADAVPLHIPDGISAIEKSECSPSDTRETASPTVSQSTRELIAQLEKYYAFRMNTVMGYVEYRSKEKWYHGWRPVDERVENGLAMKARLAGLNVWDKDIKRYLRSNMIQAYNPIENYLWGLYKKWDGYDYIGDLAKRVPNNNPHWEEWFRTWFLGMVAQWLGKSRRYGNSMVPLLISKQGYNKSTFCKSLIPVDLQWGYNDGLVLSERKSVLQAMTQFLLINLDEFNQITPRVQEGFLKNLIQQASVKVKRPYGKHVEEFPRLASFIATANMTDILSDPTGNRRFIGIELTGPIDMSRPINHDQLYAQALELIDRNEPYWLDEQQTKELMASNRQFQMRSPEEMFFDECFAIPESEEEGQYMTAAAIFSVIKKKAGTAISHGNIRIFGRFLMNIDHLKRKRTRFGAEYLVLPLQKG